MKERLRAEAQVHKDGHGETGRAKVPSVISQALGAKVGDRLIFDEGCEAAVQRALMRTGSRKYFVVYLETEPAPAISPETLAVLEEHERLATADSIVQPPELEPFTATVDRKLREPR